MRHRKLIGDYQMFSPRMPAQSVSCILCARSGWRWLAGSLVVRELFHLDDLKVRVYGDTAIVFGLETEKSTIHGKDMSGQHRFTDVFVKRDGRWQAVASHLSRVSA